MITGVEILEISQITRLPDWVYIFLIVGVIFAIVAIGCAGVADRYKRDMKNKCKFMILAYINLGLVVITWGIFTISILTVNKIPTGQYQYTISLNGMVDIDSLYEKYDVIETDGKIWTVKDKQ